MKRPFLLLLITAAMALIAATYGLVRLAYGLHLPSMQTELGFGEAAAGLVAAGGSIAYCAGALAGFFLAGTHARLLIGLAGLTAGVGASGIAVSASLSALAPSAVLASAGAGLASPALVNVVQRNAGAVLRDRLQNIVNAGTGLGLIAAGALTIALIPNWRAAWWVAAGISLLAATSVLLLDRNRSPGTMAKFPPAAWFGHHQHVIAGAILMGTASAAIWNFGRSFLIEAGLSSDATVVAWIALGVGGLFVVPLAGLLGRLPPQHAWAVSTATAGVASGLFFVGGGHMALALSACLLFGWGYTAATGSLITWTSEIEPQRAASGTALLFILFVFGQALGAAVFGPALGFVGPGRVFLAAMTLAFAAAFVGVVNRRSLDPK